MTAPLAFLAFGTQASELNWGLLAAWAASPPSGQPAVLKEVFDRAEASLGLQVEPLPAFHLAGTLNKDPLHQQSDRAKASFPAILDLAICARAARDPLKSKCRDKARTALLAWARTYRTDGNPINDSFLVPLLQAIDLLAEDLSPPDAQVILDWTRGLALSGDKFFSGLSPRNPAFSNNWSAARLLVRSMAASICRDAGMQSGTQSLLGEFAARNFVVGSSGKQDGTTYDFVQRDALHYQVYDELHLVQIALYTPNIMPPETRELVHKGVEFLRPYYLGTEKHKEFAHTTVAFDLERRYHDEKNPTFQELIWNPRDASTLIPLARAVFPDVRAWATPPAHPDLNTRFLSSLYGD